MVQIEKFDSRQHLDESFAKQVAVLLTQAIEKKGKATLAVSGGSTPKGFFNCLSKQDLSWQKVTITLADERWVDANSDASNTRLVKQYLLQNNASSATFFDLKVTDELSDDTLALLNKQAEQALLPFDVLILGMGDDGHTASLFPCSDEIEAALALPNAKHLMKVVPKTADHQRITFTLASLLKSESIFLHLCGDNKAAVLQQALAESDATAMPVRAFLHHPGVNTHVMWAK